VEKTKRSKIETSKKILFVSYFMTFCLTVICVILAIKNVDISDYKDIVLASWAELGVHTTVYSIKAKAENKVKIIVDFAEKHPDIFKKVDISSMFNE